MHTYMHTYIHTYMHIYTYIHAYIHAYIYTYIYTNLYTYIRTYIHTYLCMYKRIYIYLYIYTHMYTDIMNFGFRAYRVSYWKEGLCGCFENCSQELVVFWIVQACLQPLAQAKPSDPATIDCLSAMFPSCLLKHANSMFGFRVKCFTCVYLYVRCLYNH